MTHRPANIAQILRDCGWLNPAWDLANLFLGSIGSELLGVDAPQLVGLSMETTCFVSPAYFYEDDPFADFVVHEVAHIFHNCKRVAAGLPATRRKEWLLDIEFRKRETFAYACEAYSRILERGRRPRDRQALSVEYGTEVRVSSERVDPVEIAEILAEACTARNGWKVILERCAPPRPRGKGPQGTEDGGR